MDVPTEPQLYWLARQKFCEFFIDADGRYYFGLAAPADAVYTALDADAEADAPTAGPRVNCREMRRAVGAHAEIAAQNGVPPRQVLWFLAPRRGAWAPRSGAGVVPPEGAVVRLDNALFRKTVAWKRGAPFGDVRVRWVWARAMERPGGGKSGVVCWDPA